MIVYPAQTYFGYYENGHLRNGFDHKMTAWFYGPLNSNGANGTLYDFKFGKCALL